MMLRVISILSAIAVAGSCASSEQGRKPNGDKATPDKATLSLLYVPEGNLEGAPNVYRATFRFAEEFGPLERIGDLPDAGTLLNIDDLPASASATIEIDLFHGGLRLEQQTHHCQAGLPFTLHLDQAATTELVCVPIDNTALGEGARVFLRVASIDIDLKEAETSDLLAGRDFSAPILFAAFDEQARRISLRSDATGLTLHVGGELSFKREIDEEHPTRRLLRGERVELSPIGGRLIPLARPLYVSIEVPTTFYFNDGGLGLVLPVHAESDDGDFSFSGRLLEEPATSEFTVVSYNVENLFDQVDDERNAGYGDYRIEPNENGYSSNYGATVDFEGQTLSFTQVKARGIRRVLEAIEAVGPSVVALQEIESAAALDVLFRELSSLGYAYQAFSEWPQGTVPNAVGVGLISKFPITTTELLHVPLPEGTDPAGEPLRPIMKATLTIAGHPLIIYNNHWKSKGSPESSRLAQAKRLAADIALLRSTADYIIVGDLNSNYNEKVTLEPRHDDTDGITGINDVLKAQGDELAVASGLGDAKYNLHYELSREARQTAWHAGFGWSSMDHLIIGPGLYDNLGITYVDDSFAVANRSWSTMGFLFNEDGTTNRWRAVRNDQETTHTVGGFSDHAPIFARFRIARLQRPATILLHRPGRPDTTDIAQQQ